MTGTATGFAEWCADKFGGKGNKSDARAYAERIAMECCHSDDPPVQLGRIASRIGFRNTRPIYRNVSGDGALEIVGGEMRVVIGSPTGTMPSKGSPLFRRMKFTYAHELGHAVFWDLTQKPPCRIAPTDSPRKEEEICNGLAEGFLVPRPMLSPLTPGNDLFRPEFFIQTADLFQVSFQVALFALEDDVSRIIKPGQFCLVSCVSRKGQGFGRSKPRCLKCFVHDSARMKGKAFLSIHEGLDKVRPVPESSGAWSLLSNFEALMSGRTPTVFVTSERIRWPDNRVVEIRRVRHIKIGRLRYIWTTGTFGFLDQ